MARWSVWIWNSSSNKYPIWCGQNTIPCTSPLCWCYNQIIWFIWSQSTSPCQSTPSKELQNRFFRLLWYKIFENIIALFIMLLLTPCKQKLQLVDYVLHNSLEASITKPTFYHIRSFRLSKDAFTPNLAEFGPVT